MKDYYNKAKDNLVISRSTYTKQYETLKIQAAAEGRTALEFCVWYDFQLVNVARLDVNVFSCILDLVEEGHITGQYMKQFRLACILMQKFLQSSKVINDRKCAEYLADHPEVASRLETKRIDIDFSKFLKYDRYRAHKQMFPYFRQQGISTDLVAELVSRELLAYDLDFRNLIFLNRTDTDIIGVEKLGTGSKHFQRLEGTKPLCWHYWVDDEQYTTLSADIETVVFFDKTLNLLKYLTDNAPRMGTLYASLHTPNCLVETYENTISLLKKGVKIEFIFEDKEKIKRFENIEILSDILTVSAEDTAPAVESDYEEDLPF